MQALRNGVTYFDEAIVFFKQHYDVLAPLYVASKKLPVEIKEETKKEIMNMHEAMIGEGKVAFSAALGKDRLYHRPCGFLNDQQIWMLGVQINYFLTSVLRFDHKDFLKALKVDLGPVLGDVGLWALQQQLDLAKENKETELKKKLTVCIDIVEKFMENGLDVLGDEKKYNFMNKFGPKKCPDAHVQRSSITNLYSWQHYAPLQWFEHVKRTENEIKS